MEECKNFDLYESQKWCAGRKVLPGVRGKVFFIPKRSIVMWPKLPNVEELLETDSASKLAKYVGNFELKADKVWREMDIVMNDSSFSSESQGEKPSKTKLNKCVFKLSSIEEDATAFGRLIDDDDMVYMFLQKNGKARVIGNEMYETDCKTKQETGSGPTDKSGSTVEVEVTDVCSAPFYAGKITTADGDISGENGEAWEEVGIAPVITTATLTPGTVDVIYSETIGVTGDAPIVVAVVAGTLPVGLVLGATGIISGTPTESAVSDFTVSATNPTGIAYKQLLIEIVAA